MKQVDWREILDAEMNDRPVNGFRPGPPATDHLSVPKIVSWSEGHLEAEWTILETLHNSRGELFGGYYSVLADVALSHAAMTVVKNTETFKTIDLRVTYFRPATTGKLYISCSVVNKSRSFVYVEGMFRNEAGKNLAKAELICAVTLI